MKYRSKDELAADTAQRTGRVPCQVEVRDDGTLAARELDGDETTVGTWTKTWGGKSQPSCTAHPAR